MSILNQFYTYVPTYTIVVLRRGLKTASARLLEVYVDVDFCGNLNIKIAMHDIITAQSHTSFIIYFLDAQLFGLLN